MSQPIRVTVWGENLHEHKHEAVQKVYPDGMHTVIAAGIAEYAGDAVAVRTATLDQPEHGLTDDVLAQTDVLTWWGHMGHHLVEDAVVEKVHRRVLEGMGLLVLGEFETERWGWNVNDLLQELGLRFNNDLAEVPGHAVHGGRQLHVFEAKNVTGHPAVHGVGTVSYCSGCTVALLDERAAALVRGSDGAALVAASQVGRGRVVVAGDSDLFAEPFVSYNDNARLLEASGREILKRTAMKAVLITRGSRGMALFVPGAATVHIPIHGSDEIADVTGAGDTVMATMTLALAAGATFEAAARLANYAGGIVVMKRGTATVSRNELRAAVE